MKTKFTLILGGVLMLLAGIPMFAHHSFAGTYLEDAPPLKIEGTLKEFLLRNPHSFVIVADDKLKDDKGEEVRWSISGARLASWRSRVLTDNRSRLGPRDCDGSQGRNANDHRLRLRSIERPSDGFKYPLNGQGFN